MSKLTREDMIKKIQTEPGWMEKALDFLFKFIEDGKAPEGLEEVQTVNIAFQASYVREGNTVDATFKETTLAILTSDLVADFLFQKLTEKFATETAAAAKAEKAAVKKK